MKQPALNLGTCSAVIDGPYRYRLDRTWDAAKDSVLFVMLNPSTADAAEDDPTLRRCIHFAQRERYGSLIVVNLFAWRATDPADLLKANKDGEDIAGEDSNGMINHAANNAKAIILAWGSMGGLFPERTKEVTHIVGRSGRPLWTLGTCCNGQPRHPLYLANDTKLQPWRDK